MGRTATWTIDQLKEAIANSNSWNDVCRWLKISEGSKNRRVVRERALELKLEVTHLG